MKFFNLASIKQSRGLALAAVAVVSAVLAVGLTFSLVLNFKSSGGSLSAYLIGAVDGKDHTSDDCWGTACPTNFDAAADSNTAEAVVRLVNPTNVPLKAYVAAYNDATSFIGCTSQTVGRNSYVEVFLKREFDIGDNHTFTVKVLTVDAVDNNRIQAGVKGWLTHYFAQTEDFGNIRFLHMREAELQEVPIEVARAGEAQHIIDDCTL